MQWLELLFQLCALVHVFQDVNITHGPVSGKVGAAVALKLLLLGYPVMAHSSDPERSSHRDFR